MVILWYEITFVVSFFGLHVRFTLNVLPVPWLLVFTGSTGQVPQEWKKKGIPDSLLLRPQQWVECFLVTV